MTWEIFGTDHLKEKPMPAPDLTITTVDTEKLYGHTLVGFSDGSIVLLTAAQYDAIYNAGMGFAANIIKRVQ